MSASDLLAFLEAGPERTGQLAAWVGTSDHSVRKSLNRMLRIGVVKHVGTGAQMKWVLAVDIAIAERMLQREQRHRVNAPPPAKASSNGGTSWWVQAERERFTDLAGTHVERMRASRQARWVDAAVRDL